jgi:hypothetical protein
MFDLTRSSYSHHLIGMRVTCLRPLPPSKSDSKRCGSTIKQFHSVTKLSKVVRLPTFLDMIPPARWSIKIIFNGATAYLMARAYIVQYNIHAWL